MNNPENKKWSEVLTERMETLREHDSPEWKEFYEKRDEAIVKHFKEMLAMPGLARIKEK